MRVSQPAPRVSDLLITRLEAVPISGWHVRPRLVVGSATFFDAFDTLTLAFVLPALVAPWNLSSTHIGALIAAGYLGQLVGALIFGEVAERYGRVRAIAAATALMSAIGIACVTSDGFWSLLVLRFIQGVGIGGEMPVAAVYVNELSRAKGRGRFLLMYELVFPIGLLLAAQIGAVVVPTVGWQAMFLIGGIPGLVVAGLVWQLPESPRWLIANKRFVEAEGIINSMEAAGGLPPLAVVATFTGPARVPLPNDQPSVPRWGDLLSRGYGIRTLVVWVLWAVAGFVTNGLVNWMPTLYSSVYGLPLAQSLRAATLNNVAQILILLVCALTIDRVGRKHWTVTCFVAGAVLMTLLGWFGADSVIFVMATTTVAYGIVSSINAVLYLYTPEIYPTRFRARATGAATCWVRLSSAAGQLLVGYLVDVQGPSSVFLMFAGVSMVGALGATLMLETRNRPLEEIAG
jgi:MFS transporter, putative metabolite:H+ symporter